MALGDWRFVLVGLMFLFVVCPGVLALAWLSTAASPGIARKLRPQSWRFGPDGASVTFFTFPSDDDDGHPAGEDGFSFADLRRLEINGDFACFFTRIPTFSSPGEYYIIPVSLLPAGLAQRLTDQLYDQQQ